MDCCQTMGLFEAGGRQSTDSTQVLARARATTRLECAVEALHHALNSVAIAVPDWLRDHSPSDWLDRYGRRPDESPLPTVQGDRLAFACRVGEDGHLLWVAVSARPPEVPAVEVLRRVRLQQSAVEPGRVRWRTDHVCIPPVSRFISSPPDVEARCGKRRSTSWVGSKVHLTETCKEKASHPIVHVATTPAPVADGDVTPAIHQALRGADLLIVKHLADTGYVDAELPVAGRREYGVDLIGPTRSDHRWQSRAGEGFATSDFAIERDGQRASCPAIPTGVSWTPAVDRGHDEVIKIRLSAMDCGACPARERCTEAKRRSITVRPRDQNDALHAARSSEAT
jgi:transposase